MAYELAANPEVQKLLQKEIDCVNEKLGGKMIDYETIQSMKYMDQVVCETLRKWPAAPLIDRLCVKDYEMEYDDKKFTIEKGINFYIPIYGIHHDEQYFPQPEKFEPERFNDENKANIDPDTYIPFGKQVKMSMNGSCNLYCLTIGIGPRNCIGSRFALMEIKTIMYSLLLNFNFEVTKNTQIPLKLAPNPTQLQSEKGIWIGFTPRN